MIADLAGVMRFDRASGGTQYSATAFFQQRINGRREYWRHAHPGDTTILQVAGLP
jgi:hypothetical protein